MPHGAFHYFLLTVLLTVPKSDLPTATILRSVSASVQPVNNQGTNASLPANIYPNDSSASDVPVRAK